jgi:hypothetical protein
MGSDSGFSPDLFGNKVVGSTLVAGKHVIRMINWVSINIGGSRHNVPPVITPGNSPRLYDTCISEMLGNLTFL